jgi:hypothetical protein
VKTNDVVDFDSFSKVLNRPGGFRDPGEPEEYCRGFQVFDKDLTGFIGVGQLRYSMFLGTVSGDIDGTNYDSPHEPRRENVRRRGRRAAQVSRHQLWRDQLHWYAIFLLYFDRN